MSKMRALVAAAGLVTCLGAPASAQLVSDGGFEQFVVSGYNYNIVGGLWRFVGGSGLINGFGTGFNSPAPVAGQGNQFAFLQPGAGGATLNLIGTKVTLPTAGNYYLSFLNAGRSGPWSGGNTIFDVLLGGNQIGQFASVTDEAWSTKGASFYANPGTYDLIFNVDTMLPGDNTTFIDNVEINSVQEVDAAAVTAAPEPASLVLMATGLVGIVGVATRRKRRA